MISLKEKTVLVTGSTDGIGRQTALEIARLGAGLIIHGRNEKRAVTAAKSIKSTAKNQYVEFITADLSSQEQIRAMSDEIHERYKRLDILINNAGVVQKTKTLTVDGLETTFAVNHLAPFLLTALLLDLLKKGEPSRIINVSSMAHASMIDFSNLQGEKHYEAYQAYTLSKLGNIIFTYELAKRLNGSRITVNCLHPGVINTKLLRTTFSGGSPVSEGAKTPLYLATAPELESVTGRYFIDRKETRSTSISYDQTVRDRFWKISEELTGIAWDTLRMVLP